MDVHVSYMLGDDCVAITGGRGGSSDINITGVACGPGHGISIGSLGKDNETDDIVENVNVRSCSFTGTQNGARIKTWRENAVKVNNITFRYFEGTSSSEIAIKLDCDETENCQNITMEHINITSPTPGLVLNGSGVLHPHGEAWWSSIEHSHRPRTLGFNGSSNIIYNGLTQMNSPKNHISILNCTNVTLSNFHLIAPKDSPNTDGIDIVLSNNIRIFNSSIQTGDDCVAINGGSYDINITHVACGPGHGISIGSLGRGGENDTVQNVKIRHCSFNGTQNGARIKTWTGGQGIAKNILYENITLTDVNYPIIIDQHYCNG
ncbi:Parallel beta-helix repeat, partial [Arabidopsis thaliana x Arabidopsis arenosa]